MPKGSPKLTRQRKNEILDACKGVYGRQGFQGVTIKEISSALKISRPAIYHYFETKEEILLGLLVREYEEWLEELEQIRAVDGLGRAEAIASLSRSLAQRETMLRILNMNLFEIESNSRVERLAEFKKLYIAKCAMMKEIMRMLRTDATERELDIFIRNFDAFLIGIYPFIRHTPKQIEAMKLAGTVYEDQKLPEMVQEYLARNLP